MSRISARELTHWEAYERQAGPVGTQYGNERLAEIRDLLMELIWVTGAAHAGKDNPIPEEYVKEKFPKPSELYEWQLRREKNFAAQNSKFDDEI
jgi:hypothetical protein